MAGVPIATAGNQPKLRISRSRIDGFAWNGGLIERLDGDHIKDGGRAVIPQDIDFLAGSQFGEIEKYRRTTFGLDMADNDSVTAGAGRWRRRKPCSFVGIW